MTTTNNLRLALFLHSSNYLSEVDWIVLPSGIVNALVLLGCVLKLEDFNYRRILGSYHILFFLSCTLLVTEESGRAAFAARRLSVVARTRDISGGVVYLQPGK